MPKRKLTRSQFTEFIDELIGIRSSLPNALRDVDEDDYDGDDEVDRQESDHIESVDIEVQLSALISTFYNFLKLEEEPESLSSLFEAMFSSGDELVDVALNLEEAVNGYFGELFGENLDLSRDYLGEIIRELQRRRDKWKRKTV